MTDRIEWGNEDLLPVVVQSARSGRVLMLAYANREALDLTLDRGEAWFFSRSRGRLWRKGETSGNTMRVLEVRLDCDGDSILYLVEESGPACHTGERSCFHRVLKGSGGEACLFLHRLAEIVDQRIFRGDQGSYTRSLWERGASRIAQKVGEEGVEVALAVATMDRERAVEEAADLLYHLTVALRRVDATLLDAERVLMARHQARG